MLELLSPNRLTRIQLSDHILKQAFLSMLCICASISIFNLSTVVGLLRYTLFFKYALIKKSGESNRDFSLATSLSI